MLVFMSYTSNVGQKILILKKVKLMKSVENISFLKILNLALLPTEQE